MALEDGLALGETAAADPLADLLFTLIAAVLPAILMLAPLLDRSERSLAARRTPAPVAVTVAGVPADPIVAGADGLRLTGEGGRLVPLDRIAYDGRLQQRLLALRRSGAPLLLMVEPDGLDAAFTFEPVAAAFGPATISTVRMETSCRTTRDRALKSACRLSP